MANSYKNIVITPNRSSNTADPKVVYSGGNTTANTDITLNVYPDSNGTLSWEGSAGQLFSITNDLSNNLFGVNDVSGIPSLEIYANGLVSIAPISGNVGVRNTAPSHTMSINGDLLVNTDIDIGNSSVNAVVNSTTFFTGNVTTGTGGLLANTTRIFVGNNTINAAVNTTTLSIGGTLIANSTGPYGKTEGNLNVNSATQATNATNLNSQPGSFYTNATNITTGTLPYAQIPANIINTTAAFTISGIHTYNANIVLGSSGLSANGSFGTAGHVLHSNGTATYWAADDNAGGTVTSVASGNGITGGTITTTGTLTAVGGAGLVVNTSGINVLANTGIVANSTGTFVNATYIGTLSANNASFLGGTAAASYQLNSTLNANIASYLPTYTGVVNGSSFTVGTSFTANSTMTNTVSLVVSTNTATIGTGTYFVSNGNVGIGTATPSSRLHVEGQVSVGSSNSSLALLVYYSGNTTPVGGALGGIRLSNSNNSVDASGGMQFFFYEDTGSTQRHASAIMAGKESAWTAGSGNYPGYLSFWTRPAGATQLERMRIDSSGNIGIGTSSPTNKLQIQRAGGDAISGELWSGDGTYWTQLNSRQSAGAYSPLVAAGDHALIYSDGSGDTGALVIGQWSSSARGIRIDASGNVGIATATPDAKLAVTGTANVSGNVTIGNTSFANTFLNSHTGISNPQSLTAGVLQTNASLNTLIVGPYTISSGNSLIVATGSRLVII